MSKSIMDAGPVVFAMITQMIYEDKWDELYDLDAVDSEVLFEC